MLPVPPGCQWPPWGQQPWVPLPHQQLGRQWGQPGTGDVPEGETAAERGGRDGLPPQGMPEVLPAWAGAR